MDSAVISVLVTRVRTHVISGLTTQALATIGDTIGDTLKDTAESSLHILMSLDKTPAITLLPLSIKYALSK